MASKSDKGIRRFGLTLHAMGATALMIGVISVYYVVCKPLSAGIKTDVEKVESLRAKVRRGAGTRRQYEKLKKELAGLQRRSEAVRNRVPDSPNKAEFLAELHKISGEVGIKIDKYTEGRQITASTSSYLLVNVQFRADYVAFCGMLDRLSKLKRIAFVEKLNMKEEQKGMYSFDMSLLLYYGLKPGEPKEA